MTQGIMIPEFIKIRNNILPDSPGVYFYFDSADRLLYVGKATSLKHRVGSYFSSKRLDPRIEEMVSHIDRIDYMETPSVLEALVLEANQIKAKKPKYNVLERDDKSYLYLCITNEPFPRPMFYRGHELEKFDVKPFEKALSPKAKKKFLRVFGPYVSGVSLKRALELVRPMFPWSTCAAPQQTSPDPSLARRGGRGCFDYQLHKCPGVCVGAISQKDYRKIIKQLIQFFDGRKTTIVRDMKKEMITASKKLKFEEASILSKKIFALEHIRDVALLTREDYALPIQPLSQGEIDVHGRIEAYDISNISGKEAVGSMVVAYNGRPDNSEYRRFKIKLKDQPDDFGMMREVLERRMHNDWDTPDLIVLDGGKGQLSVIIDLFETLNIKIPVVGLAKRFETVVYKYNGDFVEVNLPRTNEGLKLLQRLRNEAHRFAQKYHHHLRLKKISE